MFTGINDPSRWVLPAVLEEIAARAPDKRWIETTEGEELAFGKASADMHAVSGYLASLGVVPGDHVAILMRSSLDCVRAWLGVTRLGAVAVLLNPELSGTFLSHQLRLAQSTLAIVDEGLLGQVGAMASEVPSLERVVVVGSEPDLTTGWTTTLKLLPWSAWANAAPWQGAMPIATDIAAIMYTSGTSGPSKAVLMPHAHCSLYGIGLIEATGMSQDDIYYVTMPLYHANGLLMQLGSCLLAGASAVVRPRFSASSWLTDIKSHRVTITSLLGSMAAFVVGRKPEADETGHGLRTIISSPNVPEHDQAFRARFGVENVISGFGMTEVNIPIWGRAGRPAPGAAGWAYDRYFDVVIANPETDIPVDRGVVGEILVRPKVPFAFMAGYFGMHERTVEAWRNLWFHTGDAATMDADGLVVFVDRIKDCIRRRGENISPSEVEAVVAGLPGVDEVVAYAVPSDVPGGEDEIMLAIVSKNNSPELLREVGREAARLLPRFASPRYLKHFDDLPRTGTGKIQRSILRQGGAVGALDRDAEART